MRDVKGEQARRVVGGKKKRMTDVAKRKQSSMNGKSSFDTINTIFPGSLFSMVCI